MNAEKLLRARLPELVAQLRTEAVDHGVTIQRDGLTILNAAGDTSDTAVVRIYDEIGWWGVSAADFTAELDRITAPNIRVEINTPGGDVFDSIAMYQNLRDHPAHVTTLVAALAASGGSLVAQAGDTRVVRPTSQMMVHNAWGMAVGDNRVHAEVSELLQQQDSVLASIYADRSGRPEAEMRDLMNAETWLTADGIIAAGLADEIIEPADKPSASSRTFNDEIADAVDAVEAVLGSAERVVALRAEAGKNLSNRNLESLDGLRERIVALLECDTTPTPEPQPWPEDAVTALQARVAVRERKVLS